MFRTHRPGPRALTLSRCAAVLLVAACGAGARDAWCQIYMGAQSANGTIVLSNFRSDETSLLVVGQAEAPRDTASRAAMPAAPPPRSAAAQPSADMRTLVDKVAKQTKVSPRLLHAVIAAESNYDPKAVSRRGAIGLMQLLPATGKRFGAADLYSAEQNLVAGASYLKWLMGLFGENLELVLAAYNAGEQAVIRAGRKVPPYPETEAYVRGILGELRRDARSEG